MTTWLNHLISKHPKNKRIPFNSVIETERLILRIPKRQDAKALYECVKRSRDELNKWTLWASNYTLKSAKHHVCNAKKSWGQSETTSGLQYIIEHKESQRIIGIVEFNGRSKPQFFFYEIGFWLDTVYAGQGFMTEAVCALTKFAFLVRKAQRVQLITRTENIAARNVATKCGFTLEAILKKAGVDCMLRQPADDCLFVRFDHQGL